MRHGGFSGAVVRCRWLTAAYALPRDRTAGICCSSWSQYWMPTGVSVHWWPAQSPMGLVDWMGLPVSSSLWVIWRTSPLFIVYVVGVPATAPSTPVPAPMVVLG